MRIVTDYNYEKNRHKALFDLICDPINWKNPIDCYIPEDIFEAFNEACVFFTGAPLAKTTLGCLLYTSPSPRDLSTSRMPSSA